MKRMMVLVMTAAMAGALFACGTKSPTEKAPQSTTTKAAETTTDQAAETTTDEAKETSDTGLPAHPVEIQMWTDFNIDEAVLQGVIDDFEAAYKDQEYTIVLDKFAGSDRATKLSLAKEAKTLPALFLSAWFTTSDEVHQGNVASIDDIAATVRDDIYPSVYDSTCVDGESYMIGLYQSYFGLLYNADHFRAAGLDEFITADELEIAQWTLDDFELKILPALAKISNNTEKYPFGLFAASNQADTHMLNCLSIYGGKLWMDGRSTAGADANVVKALEKMKEWTVKGYTNADVATKDGTEVMPDFQNQLCSVSHGQYTNYTATKGKMESGEIEEFDVRIAAVPASINGADSSIMSDYIYGASVMNNGKEDEMAVAREFLRWLISNQESLTAVSTNAMPCFMSVTEAAKGDNPLYASYEKLSDKLWDFTGNAPGYVETRKDLFPAIQSVYSGEKTAADALAQYSEKANKIIDEYIENSLVLN